MSSPTPPLPLDKKRERKKGSVGMDELLFRGNFCNSDHGAKLRGMWQILGLYLETTLKALDTYHDDVIPILLPW